MCHRRSLPIHTRQSNIVYAKEHAKQTRPRIPGFETRFGINGKVSRVELSVKARRRVVAVGDDDGGVDGGTADSQGVSFNEGGVVLDA